MIVEIGASPNLLNGGGLGHAMIVANLLCLG